MKIKIVVEFDRFDRIEATRAADALRVLGIPAHLREVSPTLARRITAEESKAPVSFEQVQ